MMLFVKSLGSNEEDSKWKADFLLIQLELLIIISRNRSFVD